MQPVRHGRTFIVELKCKYGKPSCQLEKALIVVRTVGLEIGDLKTARPSPAAAEDELDFLRPSVKVEHNHLLYPKHLQHFIPKVIDHLDRDPPRAWAREGA